MHFISIHAPPRGATRREAIRHYYRYFNSRPSARGDADARRKVLDKKNFNSRPSARGDAPRQKEVTYGQISIHAPPRGATILQAVTFHASPHFNSRPSARGDVLHLNLPRLPVLYFNSRPSARGDEMENITADKLIISIHAPPRGATLPNDSMSSLIGISIHAPPRGATKSEVRT